MSSSAHRRAGLGSRAARLAGALILTGGLGIAAVVVMVVFTRLGQRADERSRWSVAVPPHTREVLQGWLDNVSVPFVAAGIVAVVLIALARRRPAHALAAAVLVAGANVTTQVLKAGIPRPAYGVSVDGNSLPSGHTTVMVSLGLAAVLVVPRRLRGVAVALTVAAGTLTGASTLIERWHRPSDVIAAYGVCVVWAGVAALVVVLAGRASAGADASRRRVGGYLVVGLVGAALVGAGLIVGGLVAHEKPSNALVGGVVLFALGALGAVASAAVAGTVDALEE